MRPTPLVSVVIATLNRAASLSRTLDYFLARESYEPFEIIVIDQTRGEPPAIAQPTGGRGPTVRHQRVPYQHLPRARNDGAEAAAGDLIVFVDDDVVPLPGFLAAHVRAYENPEVAGATGPVLPPDAPASRTAEDAMRAALAQSREAPWVDWMPGCNMSFRRDVISSLGGFDERFFGVALGEDAEFSHRARQAGWKLKFEPGARLIHYSERTGGCRESGMTPQRVHDLAANTVYYWSRVSKLRKRTPEIARLFRKTVTTKSALRRGTVLRDATAFASGLRHGIRLAADALAAARAAAGRSDDGRR